MKRGTILVGTSKGGEYDRAYVSIVGFIDPQSGKLVKLGGDVLGGDGGAGLKGNADNSKAAGRACLAKSDGGAERNRARLSADVEMAP